MIGRKRVKENDRILRLVRKKGLGVARERYGIEAIKRAIRDRDQRREEG